MEPRELARKLLPVIEPEGTVVTVTLDLSKSGLLPPATRVFLKTDLMRNLAWGVRTLAVRDALRKIARRIDEFVRHVRPESDGLFLVAGAEVWEAEELRVPMRNFVHVGRRPYLAPLLEADDRHPRGYVVKIGRGGAVIEETRLGVRREVARVEAAEEEADFERHLGGRAVKVATGAAVGALRVGSDRDRFQQKRGEAARGVLRSAVARLEALHRRAPAQSVAFEGVPSAMVGPLLPRELRALTGRLPGMKEIDDFHERMKEGHFVALGPREVFDALPTGSVARVFVRADDPVEGVACPACGRRWPGLREKCDTCPAQPVPVSLTQEIVAHSLRHGTPAVTYVSGPAAWLVRLGGMAALRAKKGLR